MMDIIMPGFKLFIICSISVLSLSMVNEITKPIIEQQQIIAKSNTMKTVLPDATDFEINEVTDGNISAIAKSDNGYVISVSLNGFGGKIDLMVGISFDGIIQGVSVLSHSETPGLGAKAKDAEFIDQYKGQKANNLIIVVKDKTPSNGEVAAITASTITSNAVTNAVNEVIMYFNNNLGGVN